MPPNDSQSLHSYFEQQYALVQSSRTLLLNYCDSISVEDFSEQNNNFGIASIRNLLVHVANSYHAWLSRSLQKEVNFALPEEFCSTAEVRQLFEKIDRLMQEFIVFTKEKQPKTICVSRNEEQLVLSPLQLFSHVTTHEFHHKGQILSLSRHLGYTPVDTDIIL